MKKLLLLTISVVSFSIKNYAEGVRRQQGEAIRVLSFNDSTVKDEILSDPKEGFKDLFENGATKSSINTAKLNPLAVNFVQDYVQQHSSTLNKMKNWGKPYFDLMSDILTKHGLPAELKYLSVIESQLKAFAVSWAGAVGPWQFMPATARQLGLRIGTYEDERTDFYKSTHAAARYLTQLYSQFGDWLLVIAAYNGGPGNVYSAIRKSGSRNFWNLQYYLPEESRNHVKRFIATHYIMEGQGSVATLTKGERDKLLLKGPSVPANPNISVIEINGGSKYKSVVIASYMQMDISEFNRLNPNFDRLLSNTDTESSVALRLPKDKVLLFQANKMQILEQSMRAMLSLTN